MRIYRIVIFINGLWRLSFMGHLSGMRRDSARPIKMMKFQFFSVGLDHVKFELVEWFLG